MGLKEDLFNLGVLRPYLKGLMSDDDEKEEPAETS
jgi:hypothetical protein